MAWPGGGLEGCRCAEALSRDRDPGVTVEQIARDSGVHPMRLVSRSAIQPHVSARSDLRVASTVSRPDAPESIVASFGFDVGRPGPQRV